MFLRMFKKLSHPELQASKPTIGQVRKMARTPVHVVLDNIRSSHNVGAIFRTADAMLAKKLYLSGITPIPPRPEIDKVALGATSVVPWEYQRSSYDILLQLKKSGVLICVLELAERSQHYKKAVYPFPMALVIGNEVEGVSDEVMELADMTVSIPMLGRASSLNVATAFGIVAYEILDQYTSCVENRRV